MENNIGTYSIELGALTQVPAWESHRRGKNWLAKIKKDPTGPGGLGRVFLPKAKGEYFYMINDLKVGDPIEFGADYYSSSNRATRCRKYFVVREITTEKMVCEKFETASEAIKAAALTGEI
jgi:hypothetical protein